MSMEKGPAEGPIPNDAAAVRKSIAPAASTVPSPHGSPFDPDDPRTFSCEPDLWVAESIQLLGANETLRYVASLIDSDPERHDALMEAYEEHPEVKALWTEFDKQLAGWRPEYAQPAKVIADGYTAKAVEGECEKVRTCPEGSRNMTLNEAAFALGTLVGAPWNDLTEEQAREPLMGAAYECGLEPQEIRSTMLSGLRAGMRNPRPEPEGTVAETPTLPAVPKVIPSGPQSRLGEFHAALSTYIHVEDFVPYDVTLACAVGAHDTDSDPLWVMLVGPASGGKTEAVNLCDSFADERKDELTSQAALLGWLPPKGKRPGRATGLLTRIPSPAFVTIKDFAPLLDSSNKGTRDQLYSAFRGMYDGRYDREIGGVEKPVTWQGRVTLLVACTNAIDHFASHSDALGPRWVYCRLQDGNHGKAMTLRRNGHTVDARKAAGSIAAALVRDGRDRLDDVVLTGGAHEQIEAAAELCALARGSVPRSPYGKREIDGMPDVEAPYRLCGQLRLLARSLIALGMDEAEAVAIACRCALDTTPRPRLAVLEALAESIEHPETCGGVSRATGGALSRSTALRHLEDLECIGLVQATDRPDEDSALLPQPSGRASWSRAGIHWRIVPGQENLILGVLHYKSASPSPRPPKDQGLDHE